MKDPLEGADELELFFEVEYDIPDDIDDYDTSRYVDTYSPGDDFETDWFNSLE